MTRHKKTLLACIACAGLMSLIVWAQTPAPAGGGAAAAHTFPQKPVADEYLLIGDATRGSGEGQLSVDPTDPNNIVAIGMGSLQFRKGCPVPDVQCTSGQGIGKPPFSTLPSSAVTHDGGRTWKHFVLPIFDGGYNRCPDPFTGTTKDGTFLVGCEPIAARGDGAESGPVPLATGETALVVSTDKGETWSKRTDGINNYAKPPYPAFAPGLKPSLKGTSPWDRPWLWFDDETGAVYLSSSGGLTDIDTGKPGTFRTQSYFTVSHDQGRSFGTIYSFDSPEWPSSGRISPAAGVGSFAGIYVASKVPATENATCPCQVFEISYDEGKTFSRHVLKNVPVAAQPRPGEDRPILIADPTTEKRFSIMRYSERPTPRFEVSTSNDDGKTWSAFTAIAPVVGAASFIKPAMKYSRWGVIGLVWKAVYPDQTFDLWSTVSKDAGRTFTPLIRISGARSVPRPYYRSIDNDDNDSIDMSQTDLFAIWGDSRAGFQGSWFGKVSLSSYR